MLAFPSADALEVWRAYLQRCSTGGGGGGSGGAGSGAGTGSGAESSDFCGWLLKAAPGWKTFQNRFIVLDAEKCALRYFEVGPTVSAGEAPRGRARGGKQCGSSSALTYPRNSLPAPRPSDGGHGAAAGRDHSQGL